MPAASRQDGPVTAAEPRALLAPLGAFEAVALAVSGGSNKMALMTLSSRIGWGRIDHRRGLSVLTVDHGLRPESAAEARRPWRGPAGPRR